MGNTQVTSGFMMTLAGDCLVWNDPGSNYSTFSTVNVGYNPTATELLENNCSVVSASISGPGVVLGLGPRGNPSTTTWYIHGGNGTDFFSKSRKRRSAPELDQGDHIPFATNRYRSSAILTVGDFNETAADIIALDAENITTDANGGTAFVHEDSLTGRVTCLASIDGQLVFNYQGPNITQQGLADHCKDDKARWYLLDIEIELEHEGYLVNQAGVCVAENDTSISIFNNTNVSNLTDVTYSMAAEVGCKLLKLVENDPSMGAFHIEEDDYAWYTFPDDAKTLTAQSNGSILTVYQRTYNNDVLFSVDEPQIYMLNYDQDYCLIAYNGSDLAAVEKEQCESSGAGKWVFLKEEEETTTESRATPLTSPLWMNMLLLWLVARCFCKLQ